MFYLFRQEWVYNALDVDVTLDDGEIKTCRTYIMMDLPEPGHEILPSKSYIKTLVKGALESKLPESYINQLRSMRHNGITKKIRDTELELSGIELCSQHHYFC